MFTLKCFKRMHMSLNLIGHQNKRFIINRSQKSSNSRGFGDQSQYRLQDEIRRQKNVQLKATDLIAKLLQNEQTAKQVAEEYIDSLTEEFFHVASAFIQMSKKEGNLEVENKLATVIKAAMDVKQSTLRPEIQLFNKLLAAETQLERLQILNSTSSVDVLTMNDGYFFTLLERMTADVGRQPESDAQKALLVKLDNIKNDTLNRMPKTN